MGRAMVDDEVPDRLGWIYCLSNPSMPGLVKIGRTTKRPSARSRELHTTGVPTPFVVEGRWLTPDNVGDEAAVHAALAAYRADARREFFRLSPRGAVKLIDEALAHNAIHTGAGLPRQVRRLRTKLRGAQVLIVLLSVALGLVLGGVVPPL